MERIDHCTYEHEKFVISFDGGTGVWSAYDPNGEFMTTKYDLKEAMIVIEDAAEHHRYREITLNISAVRTASNEAD